MGVGKGVYESASRRPFFHQDTPSGTVLKIMNVHTFFSFWMSGYHYFVLMSFNSTVKAETV